MYRHLNLISLTNDDHYHSPPDAKCRRLLCVLFTGRRLPSDFSLTESGDRHKTKKNSVIAVSVDCYNSLLQWLLSVGSNGLFQWLYLAGVAAAILSQAVGPTVVHSFEIMDIIIHTVEIMDINYVEPSCLS